MKNQHMAEFINELKYGDIAKYGRRGDTMIAHINPNEAAMLKRMGGAGTTNPITGLREYYDFGGPGGGADPGHRALRPLYRGGFFIQKRRPARPASARDHPLYPV